MAPGGPGRFSTWIPAPGIDGPAINAPGSLENFLQGAPRLPILSQQIAIATAMGHFGGSAEDRAQISLEQLVAGGTPTALPLRLLDAQHRGRMAAKGFPCWMARLAPGWANRAPCAAGFESPAWHRRETARFSCPTASQPAQTGLHECVHVAPSPRRKGPNGRRLPRCHPVLAAANDQPLGRGQATAASRASQHGHRQQSLVTFTSQRS